MVGSLLISLALGSTLADDAPALIARLGAEAFDDRVAAYKALERLGSEALPALRAAVDSADPRVRTRSRALLESIGRQTEADRFARATPIRLDFREQPLGEVVNALNERHDLRLMLRLGPEPRRGMVIFDPQAPDRLGQLKGRAITLEQPQPVPYWEAIDLLCTAASLRYDTSSRPGSGTSPGSLVLMADRTGRGPVSDSGPFRAQITGVHSAFEQDFTRDPDTKPSQSSALNIPLALLSEPGLRLYENGPVMVDEAIDDRGRSLVPKAPARSDPRRTNRWMGQTGLASVEVDVVLEMPSPPGKTIARLKGRVPVAAVGRGADPIIVPLGAGGPIGKAFTNREVSFIVEEAMLTPGAQPTVQVTFRFGRGLPGQSRPDPNRPDFARFHQDRAQNHLELRDAAGHRLDHAYSGQTRGADSQGFYDRYTLAVLPTPADKPAAGPREATYPRPSEVRYYSFVQSLMEIPFDFHDIPMP